MVPAQTEFTRMLYLLRKKRERCRLGGKIVRPQRVAKNTGALQRNSRKIICTITGKLYDGTLHSGVRGAVGLCEKRRNGALKDD